MTRHTLSTATLCPHCGRDLTKQVIAHLLDPKRTPLTWTQRCICRLPTDLLADLEVEEAEGLFAYRCLLSTWLTMDNQTRRQAAETVEKLTYPLSERVRGYVNGELYKRGYHQEQKLAFQADVEGRQRHLRLARLIEGGPFTEWQKSMLGTLAEACGPDIVLELVEAWANATAAAHPDTQHPRPGV